MKELTTLEIKTKINELISRILKPENAEIEKMPDELEAIDSIQLLELITGIEEAFELTFDDEDLHAENLKSITSITNLIYEKRKNNEFK